MGEETIEKSMAGMFVMQKGCLRHVSDPLAELLGYAGGQTLIGQSFWELVHPEDHGRVRMGKRKRPMAPPVSHECFRVLRKDGSSIRVHAQGDIVRIEGRPAFVGCMIIETVPARDTTLPLALDRELRQRREYKGMIGKNKRMQDIYRLVEDLADLETPVLIKGESGTGKKLIAKTLHDNGQRCLKPFVVVHCPSLAEEKLERELFGCTDGGASDADGDKPGKLEAAEGGTLLLDEIGAISPLIQLKLLRVLREKEFQRIGETMARKVNVRVVACTGQDLRRKVKSGEFREDLYSRLRYVEIAPPPLRERPEDIPLLVEHFLKKLNARSLQIIEGVASDAMAHLLDYHWPGNVSELKQSMERAACLCGESWMTMEHLPLGIQNRQGKAIPGVSEDLSETDNSYDQILGALNKTFWNKTKAARMIGISRQTLYRKMHDYGMLE